VDFGTEGRIAEFSTRDADRSHRTGIRVWRLGGDGPDTLEYDSPAEAEALLATIVAHLTEQSNLLDLTGGRGGSAPEHRWAQQPVSSIS